MSLLWLLPKGSDTGDDDDEGTQQDESDSSEKEVDSNESISDTDGKARQLTDAERWTLSLMAFSLVAVVVGSQLLMHKVSLAWVVKCIIFKWFYPSGVKCMYLILVYEGTLHAASFMQSRASPRFRMVMQTNDKTLPLRELCRKC